MAGYLAGLMYITEKGNPDLVFPGSQASNGDSLGKPIPPLDWRGIPLKPGKHHQQKSGTRLGCSLTTLIQHNTAISWKKNRNIQIRKGYMKHFLLVDVLMFM